MMFAAAELHLTFYVVSLSTSLNSRAHILGKPTSPINNALKDCRRSLCVSLDVLAAETPDRHFQTAILSGTA